MHSPEEERTEDVGVEWFGQDPIPSARSIVLFRCSIWLKRCLFRTGHLIARQISIQLEPIGSSNESIVVMKVPFTRCVCETK